ncbi:Clavaminate synthase-like protein [Lepidopterella palustris CBS 459.81]|uniref:Clavaminate synthase-like protein n=1 Tax=Lepidopterella palustris CBS 459.81 TaxID=1314670 RepID=A0A8E2JB78_9PEZI|nr:Clavaminate synthase-like protein [Lepidopterella palustris CBS 459.81]
MGCTSTSNTLPIIDLAPFLDLTSTATARAATAKTIASACLEYGFFYLIGHGIPTSTTDRVISLATEFFQLPKEEKEKIARGDPGGLDGGDGARGYQPLGEQITKGMRDKQEAIDLYREWDCSVERGEKSAGPPYEFLKGPNLWPENPKELKPFYESYVQEQIKVGEALVRAMGMALGLDPASSTAADDDEATADEEVFVKATKNTFWVLRLIGYPALDKPCNADGNVEQYSCGEHSDYGCVTLLLADATPGALQVKLKDGTWMDADPIPGAFVVNIGDMIERWTNGLWQSTRHRVIHRGEGFRVSVPFFYEPDWDAVVQPLQKCIERTGGEDKYGPIKYGDYLLAKAYGNFYNRCQR